MTFLHVPVKRPFSALTLSTEGQFHVLVHNFPHFFFFFFSCGLLTQLLFDLLDFNRFMIFGTKMIDFAAF